MKIALVEWEDSHFGPYGWKNWGEIADTLKPALIESVGFVLVDEPDRVTLCLSKCEDGDIADVMTIPRSGIKKFTEVEMPKHRKHTPIVSKAQRGLMGAELGRRRAGKARRMPDITTAELESHLSESKGKKLPAKKKG